eukprot:CAMPEP_0201476448 /NCGR_PEP_ID=MMETSP0151_2-20130828/1645_1 /ASSEMBLY_ACC=CAM_ASM_000257 /TAXON_ID=200890 /ORGANISM="Paramoeba atlantica, Strain 621/1 / CCAP 1560/9" /LENGTH=546 /DNA_ID=CAMNT_0047856805 /DNA_START=80 /DNA_END=1720 /DNA_ORIENTATION=-
MIQACFFWRVVSSSLPSSSFISSSFPLLSRRTLTSSSSLTSTTLSPQPTPTSSTTPIQPATKTQSSRQIGTTTTEEETSPSPIISQEVFLSEEQIRKEYPLTPLSIRRLPRYYRISDAHKEALFLFGSEENLEKMKNKIPPKNRRLRHKLRNIQTLIREIQSPSSFEEFDEQPKQELPKTQYEKAESAKDEKRQRQTQKSPQKKFSLIDMWNEKGSSRTVLVAIVGNMLVTASKSVAFFVTGSASMLSEAIHSFADVGNQMFLAVGIRRSQKSPDSLHPYGYYYERYIWALISGVGIFFLGCGVSIYHGISEILEPNEVQSLSVAYGVLGFAFVVEGLTFLMALSQVRQSATKIGMSLKQYIARGPDPMGVAVLAEDGAAVFGVTIASGCIALAQFTENPIWDGVGSIAIGSIMAVVALFLIQKNREILLGVSIPKEHMNMIIRRLEGEKIVKSVKDVKAVVIGSDSIRFKAEIDFHGSVLAEMYLKRHIELPQLLQSLKTPEQFEGFLLQYGAGLIEELGDEVDRLEEELKRLDPSIRHIDLEVD